MNTQQQVGKALDARIYRICKGSYLQANRLPDGSMRKRHVPYSIPEEARILIKLKEQLAAGADPESILSTACFGGLQEAFLSAKT